jgi:hypothetical protein
MARASVQTRRGFARPDARSPVVVDFGTEMEDVADVTRIVACSGEWALVEGRYRPAARQAAPAGRPPRNGAFTAWVRGLCANQVTTCDGVSGD